MSAGDRPNFPLPNQRLDKVDVDAISLLKEELIIRLWAGIMGPGSGLLSDVPLTWDGSNLHIGVCRLGYAHYVQGEDGGDYIGLVEGCVVKHDPDSGVGESTVPAFTEGSLPTGWIFFKRLEVPADEENRAYWDGLSKQKKVGAARTRIREACVFNYSATVDGLSPADGWFPFLHLKGWAAGVPGFLKIHYFEAGQYGGEEYGLLFQRADSKPGVIAHTDIDEAYPASPARGLAQHIRSVHVALSKIMDSGWVTGINGNVTSAGTVGWRATPERGLTQVNDYINDVVVAKVNELVADNEVRERILFWCECDGDGSSPTITSYGGDYAYVMSSVPTATPISAGVVEITVPDAVFNTSVNCSVASYNKISDNGFSRADVISATQIQVVTKDITADAPVVRNWPFRLVVVGRASFITAITAITP